MLTVDCVAARCAVHRGGGFPPNRGMPPYGGGGPPMQPMIFDGSAQISRGGPPQPQIGADPCRRALPLPGPADKWGRCAGYGGPAPYDRPSPRGPSPRGRGPRSYVDIDAPEEEMGEQLPSSPVWQLAL